MSSPATGLSTGYAEGLSESLTPDCDRATVPHRWTPQFIADLKSGAKLDAYRMLGELMESVLAG